MVMDFDDLREIVHREILDRLDHADLNEVLENPTCELIAQWIWSRLEAPLPQMAEIVLWETATSCAVLRR